MVMKSAIQIVAILVCLVFLFLLLMYLYHWQGDTLEIRLPWLLIGATDPSQKKFLGDFISANEKVDEVIKGIGIGVYFEGQAPPKSLVTYEWQPWDIPQSTERLKASYPIIQQLFAEYE